MVQTFRDLIAENKRNSLLLVLVFCLFVTAFAGIIGLATLAYFSPRQFAHLNILEGLAVGAIAAGIALVLSLISYYSGDSLILAINHAKPLQHADDPELFNVVEEMTIAAGIPMPAIYLMQDEAPNAFATGRDPQHASVSITSGLRQKLNREELQGVIAHELAHIRNYDIRLMLLMTVLVGTVVMLADFFWQTMRFSGGGSDRRDRDSKEGSNPLGIVLIVVAVILAIIAPFLAQIIQLAVSRQREYLADATAVELTRYPLGLANALRKIDADPHELAYANRGTAHLFIANPIKKFEARAQSAFSSHPPIQDRIARLEALAHV
jgi:heat shock protein HtpX